MADSIVCAPDAQAPRLTAQWKAALCRAGFTADDAERHMREQENPDNWRCTDGTPMTDGQAEARHAVRAAMRKAGQAWQSADDAELRHLWVLGQDPALRPATRAAA